MSDRRVMRSFKLNEISAVDFPAQKGARATIMKRREESTIVKALEKLADASTQPGAKSFSELLLITQDNRRKYEADEKLWPLFSALQDSIKSIAVDPSMSGPAKLGMIRQSIEEFVNSVASEVPDVERELEKLLKQNPETSGLFQTMGRERIEDMTHEELQKAIATGVAAELAKAAKKPTPKVDPNEPDADDETAKAWRGYAKKLVDDAVTKAQAEAKAEFDKAAEIAKGDEVIVDGEGNELRKSAIGEAAFKFLKSQAEKIELATFEKKAQTEIGTLPGELALKAKILRAVSKMDKEIKEGLEAMLKGGAAALKSLTKSRGSDISPEVTTAEQQLEALTKAEMEKSKTGYATAYSKVLESSEGQKLYNDISVAKRAASQGRAA